MAIANRLTPEQVARTDLLTILLSREIRDESIVVMGTATPLTAVAALVALATHAPGAYYTSPFAGGLSVQPHIMSFDSLESNVFQNAILRSAQIIDLWEFATINPRMCDRWIQFFRPAQIDAFGNINNSRIHLADGGVLQLPGSVGISDMAAFYPRLYAYVPRHRTSALPEHVDYVSAPGTLGTTKNRRERGLRWGRPYRLYTDLCIFEFDEHGKAEIASLHGGTTYTEVVEATGFSVARPEKDCVTPGPTSDELAALAQFDPSGLRYLECLDARARRAAIRAMLLP